jgi:cytochrome c-type biogenesis protein
VELTIALAFGAGLLSFLSPCVLPLVPAYIGQLSAVAVVGRGGSDASPSRWLAIRHAIAYVLGFGAVFTVLGLTATYVGGPLFDWLPLLRQAGGVLLIVLGLNLAGFLRIPALDRSWRPLEAGAAASVAGATGTVALGAPQPAGTGPGSGAGTGARFGEALGGRIVSARGGWLASLGLGAIFAIGWTPCVGVILGGILGLAAEGGSAAQGTILLAAYTAGLGIPFLLIAAAYDRAPRLLAPLLRHGRAVSIVGGLLVVAIGIAMLFDLLRLLPQFVPFNTQI